MSRRISKGRNGLFKFDPVVPGSPVTPLFFSDFTAAVGTSATARSDGSKWTIVSNDVEVVVNPGTMGFPSNMANILRVPWYPVTGGTIMRKGNFTVPSAQGILPIPAIGDRQYYRWYFHNTQPYPTTDPATHPVQDGVNAGTVNWELSVRNDATSSATEFENQIFLGAPVPATDARMFQSVNLLKNRTYRFEVMVYRDTTTTYKLDWRVYDEVTDPLVPYLTADDYVQTLPSGGALPTLAEYMAAQSHPYVSLDTTEGINIGCNDPGASGETGDYGFQNGVVVTRNETYNSEIWIGPYGATYVIGEAA